VFTVLGFSLGWLAWGALVAVLNALMWIVSMAIGFYALLLLLGALIFTGIAIRQLIARHTRNRSRSDITPPIVVSDGPECSFYRSSAAAATARLTPNTKVFDAHGLRLVAMADGLRVSAVDPHGAEELASILRNWLGYMDAIRWSTADMELPLLLQASVEHLGDSA
jgi:hypothetical protein